MNMYLKKEKRSDPRRKGKKKVIKATTWYSDSESEYDSEMIPRICISWSKGITPLR